MGRYEGGAGTPCNQSEDHLQPMEEITEERERVFLKTFSPWEIPHARLKERGAKEGAAESRCYGLTTTNTDIFHPPVLLRACGVEQTEDVGMRCEDGPGKKGQRGGR